MNFDDAEHIRKIVWDIDAIRQTLNGDNHLKYAFSWNIHAFKFEFWSHEEFSLIQGKPLSPKAREELERIIVIMELL